jgi:hypothetical protein
MESQRISTVKKFLELCLNEERELENLVYLAAEICHTPIASINFVDDKKQYPVTSKGALMETSCDVAFCNHTINGERVLEIPDALNDSIFATNPLVTGDPYIRFYAGAPLITKGVAIGALCVIDHQPKKLTDSQIASLQILARQVMHRLELHYNAQLIKESVIEEVHHKELLEQAEVMKTAFYDNCEDYFLLLNNTFEIVSFNASAELFFSQRNNGPRLIKGKKITQYLLPSNVSKVERSLKKAQEGQTNSFEILANPNSENAFWNRFSLSPAYNSKKELIGIACIGCNIDKEKKQQEKIELQYAVLSKIAKIHAHEIRHPLTNILAIIELLKKEDFTMTKQYIEFLEASSKELDQVIRGVVMDSYTSASANLL